MTFEEAKFYPPADLEPVSLEPGDLPSSYGKNRLVLLPVDPYLMYTYWELAADPPPTTGSRAVLRFHESSVASDETRPFDVDIDLEAGHWYVHLWSPEKVYQADLGLRGEDGSFVALAHSNTVRTPPASPVPQAEAPTGTSAPPVMAPEPEPFSEPEAVPEPSMEADAAVVPQIVLVDPDVVQGEFPPTPDAPVEPLKRVDAAAVLQRRLEEVFAMRSELPPMPEAVVQPLKRVDAAAVLQRKLEELFAIRGELPPMPEPYFATDVSLSTPGQFEDELPAIPLPFDLGDLAEMDLTEYSEARFTPGISSEGGPLVE